MKKSMIRLLSLMLCLISLVSLLPVTALAADSLSTPTKPKWHKYAFIDENGELFTGTQKGNIYFKVEEPYFDDMTLFLIKVYRDKKKVEELSWGYDNQTLKDNDGYVNIDLSPYITKSGTYHVTVKAMRDWDGTGASGTAKSETWKYTAPSKKVGKPTKVRIDWPYVKWSHNSEKHPQYQLEVYFSEKKGGDSYLISSYTVYDSKKEVIPPFFGTGYYSVRIRGISGDITKKAHSSWVELEPTYCKFKGPDVKVSNVSSSGKVKLSWSSGYPKQEASWCIEKYNIYRSTSKDSGFKKIATTTETSYTDKDVKAGKKYYYKVKTVAFGGETSKYSSVDDIYGKLPRPDVTITLKSGDPKLSWDKISGAEKYYIYRATSKSGEYEKIKETTSTSFTDKKAKAGKKYYYKVKAIHSKSGGNSAYSSVDSIKAK